MHLSSLYEYGTFCKVFHEQQGGWRNCVSCEELFHCGCIMSGHLFEINDDASGIRCKACLCWELDVAPSRGTTTSANGGSSVQLPPSDGVASTDEDCPSEGMDSETKATSMPFASPKKTVNPVSPGTSLGVRPSNLLSQTDESYSLCTKSATLQETGPKKVLQNSRRTMRKKMVERTEAPHPGLTYLFENDANMGHLLIPKSYVEACLLTPEQRGALIRNADVKGKVWSFELLSWANPYNRMHLLGGTMNCIREMQWEVGNIFKYFNTEPCSALFLFFSIKLQKQLPSISPPKSSINKGHTLQ